MSNNKQKLELTWIGKNNPEYDIANIEPRILEERADLSNGDPNSESMLIHGDNLLALKALLPEYEGKVKCVYIDPPYNTGNAFKHYDDSVEHSTWLSLMKPRLEILWKLLHRDGALWVSIDDNEGHYLKILCDEIFGRQSFVATVVWENFYGRSNAAAISPAHNYQLVYAPLGLEWKNIRNLLARDEKSSSKYTNPDNDPRGPWRLGPIFAAEERHEGLMYTITTPSGRSVKPPKGSHWRMVESDFWKMAEEGRIAFGAKGDNIPAVKLFLSEVQAGLVPRTWWPHTEVGHSQEAKREIQELFPDIIPFGTPKPERLLHRVIELSSNPNDWVLDSFLGSGTTAAVAHKMGRKYIGIEMGDHAYSHCKVRLDKVTDGTDQGGISKVMGWNGGGGYKFYELAPSFIAIDEFRNPVIDSYFNDTKLIRAMCKLANYTFAPSQTEYWKHGKGQGNNSIYITTQMLSVAMVQQIASHLEQNETLLICPKKYEPGCKEVDPRITIKKIPQSVLKACQFGKKEYLLPIKESAIEELDEEDLSEAQE